MMSEVMTSFADSVGRLLFSLSTGPLGRVCHSQFAAGGSVIHNVHIDLGRCIWLYLERNLQLTETAGYSAWPDRQVSMLVHVPDVDTRLP
jgi:hypothetical protein